MRQNPKALEIFKHFKGKYYQIVTMAMHTETREELVIYRPLYESQGVYARPLSMFMSEVDHDKYPDVKQQYRFERVNLQEQPETTEPIRFVDHTQEDAIDHNRHSEYGGGRSAVIREKCEHKEYTVMDFLDADTYEHKLEILRLLRNKLDEGMINTIAVSLDLEPKGGSIEEQYEDIKYCLMTLEKYECNRLR